MKKYHTFACRGTICNPLLRLPEQGMDASNNTHATITIEQADDGKYYLSDGWKNVVGVGPCCPRCLTKEKMCGVSNKETAESFGAGKVVNLKMVMKNSSLRTQNSRGCLPAQIWKPERGEMADRAITGNTHFRQTDEVVWRRSGVGSP